MRIGAGFEGTVCALAAPISANATATTIRDLFIVFVLLAY
jgi:hypothetical protein